MCKAIEKNRGAREVEVGSVILNFKIYIIKLIH